MARGEKTEEKNSETQSKKKNTETSIGPAIAFIPADIPAEKEEPKTSVSTESRHLHHLRSCWKTKAYGGTEAKESRRKSHTQTRGTTALQASSPSPEAGTPILHPVLHSLNLVLQEHCAKVI